VEASPGAGCQKLEQLLRTLLLNCLQIFASVAKVGCVNKPAVADATSEELIIYVDIPSTAQAPFIYNVHDEASWPVLAERIIDKHID
jgi:hypothetical protein